MKHLNRFVHDPLVDREIRLVTLLPGKDSEKISCIIHHASLDDKPHFEALSYVWGADDLYASVLVNGKPFLVRRNLWFALYYIRGSKQTVDRNLREDEAPLATNEPLIIPMEGRRSLFQSSLGERLSRIVRKDDANKLGKMVGLKINSQNWLSRVDGRITIWIDAMCINQDDISERSAQVQLMGNIYEKATRLHIWLGEQSQNTIIAMENFSLVDKGAKFYLECPGEGKRTIERISQEQLGHHIAHLFDLVIEFFSQTEEDIGEANIYDNIGLDNSYLEWRLLKDQWLSSENYGIQEKNLIQSLNELLSLSFSIRRKPKMIPIDEEFITRMAQLNPVLNRWQNAQGALRKIHQIARDFANRPLENSIERSSREGLIELCHRPYWTRLWVVQEAVLGAKPIIRCGAYTLDWVHLENFLSSTIRKGAEIKSGYIPGYSMSPEFRDQLGHTPAAGFLKSWYVTTSAGVGNSSLRSLITSFSAAVTKDPRDMVYGLLALSNPSQGIMPDYSQSTINLYIKVIKASLWTQSAQWSGTDSYLVSFSRLLHRVLGEPFWDNSSNKFIAMKDAVPGSKEGDEVCIVGGLLGKRMEWGTINLLPKVRPPTQFVTAGSHSLEVNDFNSRLSYKEHAWLTFDSSTQPRAISQTWDMRIIPIAAINNQEPSMIYEQEFTAYPFFTGHQQLLFGERYSKDRKGIALLSTPGNRGDYLCFFKDCNISAIVRERSCDRYSIVGYAIIDCTPIAPLEDWTTECDVEMSLETLQRLTM